ncbi:DUF2505 domain-containing protein [Pseudonocardia sp. DSM 110487]|uniref:DUF2505 domain-containing protein n=1 Tax=Pseudonocardia sp. DSM 110487 TaxID=2865833 RepID=UPI001C699855|nr:DUF2505 domain-containing protein [Pseudonocardia sp. DSM 110487]QYN36363.1 DUF2505 domain-containing protein [Pseudonocardia sp. DSM 110487]
MSRQIDFRSVSPHPADEVYATMVDPDYLRARLERIGGPGANLLEHSADVQGARYRLRLGLDAKDLPAVVRSVLPGNLTIERNERWTRQDSGRYLGDVDVTIPGAPASATGGMRLRDLPEGGSELNVRADVRVSVPLIGGKIEGVVGEQVQRLLTAETAFTDEWLAQNAR